MRHDWPVLREGTLHVVSVHQDCLVIERTLSKDENPAKQKGPAHVLAALNRSSETRSLAVAGRTILLQPYGWLLEADNQMVDLDQAST